AEVVALGPIELRAQRAAGIAAGNTPDRVLLLGGAGIRTAFRVARAVAERSVEATNGRRVVRSHVGLARHRNDDHAVAARRQAVHRGVDVVRTGLRDDAVRPENALATEAHVAPATAYSDVRIARGPETRRGVGCPALAAVITGVDVDARLHHHEGAHAAAQSLVHPEAEARTRIEYAHAAGVIAGAGA